MTAVALPALPKTARVSPRLLGFGAMLTPALGGAQQYVARLGDRYAVDVSIPALGDCAGAWIAALIKAKTLGVTLTLVMPRPAVAGLPTGAQVSGAGQTGAVLSLKGLGAAHTLAANTFFSFVAGGRHYLHSTTEGLTASGGGTATPGIGPLLRASPAADAAVEFVAPVLEGFLAGPNVEWDLDRLRFRGLSFTLAENE